MMEAGRIILIWIGWMIFFLVLLLIVHFANPASAAVRCGLRSQVENPRILTGFSTCSSA